MDTLTIQNCIDNLGWQLYDVLRVAQDSDLTNNASLALALKGANGMVWSFVSQKYKALNSIDNQLVIHGCAIVMYNLLGGRPDQYGTNDKGRYTAALDYLQLIADGDIALDGSPAGSTSSRLTVGASKVKQGSSANFPTDAMYMKDY